MSIGSQQILWYKGVASVAIMLLVVGFMAGYMYAAWERQYVFWERLGMWFQGVSRCFPSPSNPQTHAQIAAAPMSALVLGLLAKRAGLST